MTDDTLKLADFRALLQLQEVDSTIDQVRLKRENLPGHAVLKAVQEEAGKLRPPLEAAVAERAKLQERQDKLDAEVAAAERRIKEINDRLYDPASKVAPSDALAMTQEVRHLQERQKKFEDEELEIMEQVEAADEVVKPLQGQAEALAAKMVSARTEIQAGQEQIDAELVGLGDMRAKAAAEVPGQLMDEYDKLRARLGGLAVAPLNGNSCGGCHIAMSASEVAAIKSAPESALVHCEECDRLLVR